jgi:hypothetical protein
LTYLQSVNVVGKNNDLVTPIFVILDEELARLELVGVHAVQEHALSRLLSQVFPVKFGCHGAPYLGALSCRYTVLADYQIR